MRPIDACHLRSGISKMEVIEEPLIFAVPHSVSTVNSFRSVAPVIESPFFMMTVVDASSAEANRTPATSPIGTLAFSKRGSNGNGCYVNDRTVIFCPPTKSTEMVIGPHFRCVGGRTRRHWSRCGHFTGWSQRESPLASTSCPKACEQVIRSVTR